MTGNRHICTVVPFPNRAIRAWVVVPIDGEFRGELVGGRDLLDDGPDRTAVGPLVLVMAALVRRDVRQGLPIVQMLDLKRDVAA
jgi:hypothetical protein